MEVVFVSNYLNHHQIPFSNAMYKELNGKYFFIQTEPMEEERFNMGWKFDENEYPYLIKSYEDMELSMSLINECDVVIIGSAPNDYIKERIAKGKLTFRYSERIYKKGQWRAISPRGIYYMYKAHAHAKKRNMYMLCASAYTACDLNLFGYYRHRMLKWGYFPEKIQYDINDLLHKKDENRKVEIVWCGRFIEWKHPELVIELTQYLKKNSMSNQVHITMVGIGEMREGCERVIKEEKLDDCIDIIGPLTPNEVREKMLTASLFLATSDYQEGWGAVVNEAMNSACVVIASHAMGSVPYLIQHQENGLIYKSGDIHDFITKVEWAITHPKQRRILAKHAYETIDTIWNAENAVTALLEFIENEHEGKITKFREMGPCSEAEVIQQWAMYRKLI